MATATARLREAMDGMKGPALDALADRAGAPRIAAWRAFASRPVCVDTYLKLCRALGIDPVTGGPSAGPRIGDFNPIQLGCAARMVRYQRQQGQRGFAKAADLTLPTLFRIEQGDAVSVKSTLTICAFLGRHPHDFTSPPASRETAGTARLETKRQMVPA